MFQMPSTASGYNQLFPYPMDKEDMVYFEKGVQSIFQELCSMRQSWKNQCYTRSEKVPLYEGTDGDKCIPSEHNYHADTNNYNPESISCPKSGSVCKTEDVSTSKIHDPEELFSEILSEGIDQEDMEYLERGFHMVLWDKKASSWADQLKWIPHPTTADGPSGSPCDFEEMGPKNKSGSARTEGYIKRAHKYSKMQANFKPHEVETKVNGRVSPYRKTYKGNKKTLSRDARNDQRRLSTAFQTITHSNLLNLNELKFRKKKLRLGKSEIHGLGLFASEPIGPNEIIIEYVGQIIRPIIADLRENSYKQSGLGYYCFLIDDGTVVDATKYGNINRYINHSCNPNSYAKILVINNQKKIVIYSKRHIKADEEITYDYKMKIEDEKIECLCKAPGCRKSLN